MAGKVLGDAILGAVLFAVQWGWYRAFCAYCVTAASLSVVAVGLVVPETRAALRKLRSGR